MRIAASFLVVVSLVACSGMNNLPVTPESHQNWDRYQQQLKQFKSWDIHARSVITIEQEVYQIGINWQREAELFVILIEAPFGQGVFRVESSLQVDGSPPIKLSMPDGQEYFDETAEALLVKVLGWPFPVEGLKSWIKGLPLSGTEYTFDLWADGRLKTLEQDGWLINYREYFSFDSTDHGLPRKMNLKHANLALRIVVERWHQIESELNPTVLFPEFN